MSISSRTPEGLPSHCPLCGGETNLEFSDPAGDAPCPHCGHLLWMSGQMLRRVQVLIATQLGATPDKVTVDTPLSLTGLGADSLDTVELVMMFEEELEVTIPDVAAESAELKTVGDLVRLLERDQRRDAGEF